MRASCLRADQMETDRLTSIARSASALWVIVMVRILERQIGKTRNRTRSGTGTKAGSGEGGAVGDGPAGEGRVMGQIRQARGGRLDQQGAVFARQPRGVVGDRREVLLGGPPRQAGG